MARREALNPEEGPAIDGVKTEIPACKGPGVRFDPGQLPPWAKALAGAWLTGINPLIPSRSGRSNWQPSGSSLPGNLETSSGKSGKG
jgi:hypothetical protein